jgi:hypothetical protein
MLTKFTHASGLGERASGRRRTGRGVRPHLRLRAFSAEKPVHPLQPRTQTICKEPFSLALSETMWPPVRGTVEESFQLHVWANPTWKTHMLSSTSSTNIAKPIKYIIWKRKILLMRSEMYGRCKTHGTSAATKLSPYCSLQLVPVRRICHYMQNIYKRTKGSGTSGNM